MKHPLDGAVARVNRASKHLTELKCLADGFGHAYHDAILVKFNAAFPNDPYFVLPKPFPTPEGDPVCPMPEDIGVLVGEISYNLRGALDYLVYELARLDSGSTQEFTQFPIEDRKTGFDKIAPRRLIGLNARHRALIEARQPYRGCDWTDTLKEISNPDKHRKLTQHGYSVVVTTPPIEEVLSESPQICTIRFAERPDGAKVYVLLGSSMRIQIWVKNEPVAVVEVLEMLQSQVADTIEALKAEF